MDAAITTRGGRTIQPDSLLCIAARYRIDLADLVDFLAECPAPTAMSVGYELCEHFSLGRQHFGVRALVQQYDPQF